MQSKFVLGHTLCIWVILSHSHIQVFKVKWIHTSVMSTSLGSTKLQLAIYYQSLPRAVIKMKVRGTMS